MVWGHDGVVGSRWCGATMASSRDRVASVANLANGWSGRARPGAAVGPVALVKSIQVRFVLTCSNNE